jgi:REP element-mobilizing transposase RayT
MARKNLIRSSFFPYHVSNRCNNREWFKLPLETVWKVTTTELYRIALMHGVEIHAFVLMSNHYHLLISTPDRDLGIVMSEFGSSVTRTFNTISGRLGHLFNGPYKWSQIQTPNYYSNALKYVYRNPVRAGIVPKVEDYCFSTLPGLLGMQHLPFPLYNPRPEIQGISLVPPDTDSMVDWFNQPFQNEIQSALDRGFRRKVFALPRNQKTGKIIELDSPFLNTPFND